MSRTLHPLNELATRSQLALGLSHREFGTLLGVSGRTSERWAASQSTPGRDQLALVARHVHAEDPELAAEIAAHLGQSLESLGIAAQQPATRTVSTPQAVDIVVCAAAEAIDVSPRTIRTALHAAFKHARTLGLDVATLEAALAPREASPPASAKRPSRS
jgi:hypothetical protein